MKITFVENEALNIDISLKTGVQRLRRTARTYYHLYLNPLTRLYTSSFEVIKTKFSVLRIFPCPNNKLLQIPNISAYLNKKLKPDIKSAESDVQAWFNGREVRSCQSERMDKKYEEPLFGSRIITCEKDMWTASEINIHDTLTPLDRSICFLDGRALEGIARKPDFTVVDENLVLLPLEYKTRWVLKVPCIRILSHFIFEKKSFKRRNLQRVKGDQGWLQISDAITNASTDHTLLKSVAYLIFIASSNRYAPFIEKPIMVAVDGKKISSLKEPTVITRSQSRQTLGPLNSNTNL
ncbi:8273_t:CDS:2 [Funneliformis geosporum]|uniref:8273_t:CDS:1 n=1 Tax=Funneliformis geosporum TaxID=1117311 RepID=A0A9W4SDI2_9GLOM|nr:8273_t:CDS:2 [Funneliformis geosporum]